MSDDKTTIDCRFCGNPLDRPALAKMLRRIKAELQQENPPPAGCWALIYKDLIADYEGRLEEMGSEINPAESELIDAAGPVCRRCAKRILAEQKKLRQAFAENPDPNQRLDNGFENPTPILLLSCRCPWGFEDFIRQLCRDGARPYYPNLLFETIVYDQAGVLAILAEYGARLRHDPPGAEASRTESSGRDSAGALKAAARIRPHGFSLLHLAAEQGSTRSLAWLLRQGLDPDTRDQYGRTPLHLAAKHNRTGAAEVLLEAGADIQALDGNGRSPLRAAVKEVQPEMTELLLRRGALKGLDQTLWNNLRGMASKMLAYAVENQAANPSGSYWPQIIKDRRLILDLMSQYRGG